MNSFIGGTRKLLQDFWPPLFEQSIKFVLIGDIKLVYKVFNSMLAKLQYVWGIVRNTSGCDRSDMISLFYVWDVLCISLRGFKVTF